MSPCLSQKAHARSGFTLTELAIVLGVVGTVFAGIFWGIGRAHQSQKVTDALTEMQTIVQNMDNMLLGRSLNYGAGTSITSAMITAKVIPSTYVSNANHAAADNPWSAGNLALYQSTPKKFRVTFYKVGSKDACIQLLLQATSCDPGQPGCPVAVYTDFAVTGFVCYPNQNNCPTAATSGSPAYNASNIGWRNMTTTIAKAMCDTNGYTNFSVVGFSNSVEFDFSL